MRGMGFEMRDGLLSCCGWSSSDSVSEAGFRYDMLGRWGMPYSTVAGADGEASSFVTRSVEQASTHSE